MSQKTRKSTKGIHEGHRRIGPLKSFIAGHDRCDEDSSREMLNRVRGQLQPAFTLAISFLSSLSEELGLGALAVWFGTEGIEEFASVRSKGLEWQDEPAWVIQGGPPLGPRGEASFCAKLRRNKDADLRCHECDAQWIARARQSGRSWAYQCHAGLSEVIAPIMVRGKPIGEIMGGQIATDTRLPKGFRDVWMRLRDIPGLDRKELEKAFSDVHVVNAESLRRIQSRLQEAARLLGALIERVADLMEREKLLGQMKHYVERDFAWFALTEQEATQRAVLSRARALGLSGLPTLVIIVLLDRTARSTFRHSGAQFLAILPELFQAAQNVTSGLPHSIVTSIRPDELVVLFGQERTRNPKHWTMLVEELVEELKRELESRSPYPLLVGVSDYEAPFVSLARAYEEAHENLGRKAMMSVMSDDAPGDCLLGVVSKMRDLSSAMRRAAIAGDRELFESAVESHLRLVSGVPGNQTHARLCLFTSMVTDLISIMRSLSGSANVIDEVETAYALAMPALQTASDMVEWFRVHLLPLAYGIFANPSGREDRWVSMACDLASQRLSEAVSRDEVAKALGLSSTHFGRIFRKRTGMTFREFLKKLRVSKAQELLLLPGRTVADVALELGYGSTAAFSRGFKEGCGGSPCEYRSNPSAYSRVLLSSTGRSSGKEGGSLGAPYSQDPSGEIMVETINK